MRVVLLLGLIWCTGLGVSTFVGPTLSFRSWYCFGPFLAIFPCAVAVLLDLAGRRERKPLPSWMFRALIGVAVLNAGFVLYSLDLAAYDVATLDGRPQLEYKGKIVRGISWEEYGHTLGAGVRAFDGGAAVAFFLMIAMLQHPRLWWPRTGSGSRGQPS